ncbi:hypothetical protein Ae406Ps2_6155 [Pseudonocardia sp. Ae406_Ps2]|uniref:hypothetical protein n=1 Tax=unclassified Pseudonocardia TaxID=2619320 RepID=UPI00095C7D87|nr:MULTISPECIES: hypothetical protein [unclassified Pseudonocardia]OLM09642.1 hypothetical protein Ae706Ps2_6104c [Pseudonocardia sp. Ae706_Ps2]OLL89693.1 hypothetical protein Ae331Ps2_6028c [Pseudonocardia sp. Ae331_Ps2]OLL96318.1 hypothetical protein Ae406Ps2_6155 [Pseudonocardia sp. Ae406_Ps2]OLM28148.1 hypothetical protein Ae717Ps2_6776c [Pseudonocardia sp. Ae717_Ps2]OLM28763.1 hypothetical protein Ae717Ps2_6082c [Pseudonocardia sp. Ae717_Ps2]
MPLQPPSRQLLLDQTMSALAVSCGTGEAESDPAAPQLCVSCRRRSGSTRDTPLRSVVCGPCWFAGGGDISPSELADTTSTPDDLATALDAVTALPRTALDWYRGLLGSPWYQQIRRDAAGRLRGLLEELARRADWDAHTSWPTWDRLQLASGWRRSSTAAWLAELQRQGWLSRVEGGSTPQYRPIALQHLSGNRAAVYQLRVPATEAAERGIPTLPEAASSPRPEATAQTEQDTTWTPTHPLSNPSKIPTGVLTRARACVHSSEINSPSRNVFGPTGPGHEEKQGGYFADRVPVTGAEMLAAAAELRSDPALRRLTPRWIRAIVRRWWEAGWTNNDLRFAIAHQPTADGPARAVHRCPAAELRSPDGWLRHRLRRWSDDRGPLVSPSADARHRRQTAAEHGQAAADRLPYGAADLSPTDLHITSDDHRAARSALVRRWAAEFTASRNAPRPAAEVATPEDSKRHYRRISRDLDAGRQRRTATPPPAEPSEPTAAAAPASSSPGTGSPHDNGADIGEAGSAHERALARARVERTSHAARPLRRAPRRFR